jgi:tRNA(Ile)-lysidine synthase
MSFNWGKLLSQLVQLPSGGRFYIAYSGGLDSSVLLHATAQLRPELDREIHAIHADHGLQADASSWSEYCEQQCAALDIQLHKVHLNLQIPPGESLEAVARAARYTAFSAILGAGDILLTAHHADDQVETVLLQLLRGTGVSGLAGMPLNKSWHQGWLARPLLPFSRLELEQYAVDNALHWMEDASNQDVRFSRNLLRQRIVPELKGRWPGLLKTIGRSAGHCASAAKLLDELAEMDLRACLGANPWRLSMVELEKRSRIRQENLLRYWIKQRGLNMPNAHKIRRILSEVLTAGEGSHPLVKWRDAELRRYAGELYLMPPLPGPEPGWLTSWDGSGSLKLPAGLGELQVYRQGMSIPESAWLEGRVQVGFRSGGFNCTPAGRTGSRSFKRLCQDMNIPAWLRPLVPLLLVDGEPAAVADYCVCKPFAEGTVKALVWSRDAWLS